MSENFSSEWISETGNLDAVLTLCYKNLHLMSWFLEVKSNNRKLTKKEMAQQLDYSVSKIKRYMDRMKRSSL